MPLYRHQYKNENISAIPETFTANDSISGYLCSASLTDSDNYPWKVWTQSYSTSEWTWWSGPVSLPQWIQIEVPAAFVPSAFMVMNEIASPLNMKSGVFQGSNNGSDWTDLYTISNWGNTAGYKETIELTTNTAYRYFRLYVTEGWQSDAGVSIQAMQIFRKEVSASGFDELGHPEEYYSADDAGCNILSIPSGYLWGYLNGKLLPGNNITATRTGNQAADSNGYFDMGSGNYFDLNSTVLTGRSARTFVLQATISPDIRIQFIDGGSTSDNEMFGLGWGKSGASIFYHFWANDNQSWLSLSPGSYILAFVYDGSVLTVYKDGTVLGTYNTVLNTGSGSNYRIGQYVIDDWYSGAAWKSMLCAIYDRVLTQDEITKFQRFI